MWICVQSAAPGEEKLDAKSAEDLTTWGATKRRTLQSKSRDSGISESQNLSTDSRAISTASSVASTQPGHPARFKTMARKAAPKREKEQTLTSLLTARSEVSSCAPMFAQCSFTPEVPL